MKFLSKISLLLLATAGLSLPAAGDQTNYAIGSSAGPELRLSLGARPTAMGEAFTALADDANATAWNPAGLSQVLGSQVAFMHNLYIQETSQEYLAFGHQLFNGAGVGANITYFNYGKIEKYTETAEAAGDFTPTVLTAALGYGQWLLPELAAGLAVKFFNQNIDTERYSAVAADLGVLVKPGLEGLQLGAAAQNLGGKLADSDLPALAKAGAAYALPFTLGADARWTLALEVQVPFADSAYTSVNIGTEYAYAKAVALRAGYKVKNTGELSGVSGLTAGVGVKYSFFALDYALATFGDLGVSNQVALSVAF